MNSEWVTTKLGEVCDMYQPKTISSKQMIPEGQYPVYGANGIIGRFNKFNHNEPQVLLTCRGATCGSVNVSLPNSWINGNAMVVKAIDNSMDQRFLEYALKGGIDLSNAITGAAQPQITRQSLSQVKISYPKSLSEQRRIVAILDEAFAAIDKAKANTEQNLRNARELFESYLQGVFEKKGEGWEETSLQKEIKLITGFAFKSPLYSTSPEDILLVRGDNIMQGYFRWDDAKRWPKREFATFSKFHLCENDIVLAMDRPWVKAGLKCAMISKHELPALLVQRTACIRPKKEIDHQFLYYIILSTDFSKHLLSNQTGIGVPHISGKQILEYRFYKPTLKEQARIIGNLNNLRSHVQKIEHLYKRKLEDLEEIKKSILQKAFSGEIEIPIELV
jgi:type I restriction enzyme, S subunit